MKQLIFLSLIVSLIFFSCQKKNTLNLPKKVKVTSATGVSVREISDGKSSIIGTAYHNYVYDVTDGVPGYYQIAFQDGKRGWVCANPADNWTARTSDGKVKILLKGGIVVREEPYNKASTTFGIAAENYAFDLLGADYLYLQIKLPDNKQGWIYIGKPGDCRVAFIN